MILDSRNTKAMQLRAQEKTLRVLKLIDLMAGFRQSKTASELLNYIKSDCCVSLKTIQRDLALLSMLGWVEVSRIPAGKAKETQVYKLDVKRTERLQTVAIQVFG